MKPVYLRSLEPFCGAYSCITVFDTVGNCGWADCSVQATKEHPSSRVCCISSPSLPPSLSLLHFPLSSLSTSLLPFLSICLPHPPFFCSFLLSSPLPFLTHSSFPFPQANTSSLCLLGPAKGTNKCWPAECTKEQEGSKPVHSTMLLFKIGLCYLNSGSHA